MLEKSIASWEAIDFLLKHRQKATMSAKTDPPCETEMTDVDEKDIEAGESNPAPTAPHSVFSEMMDRGRESAQVVLGTAVRDDEMIDKKELEELRKSKEELERLKERQAMKNELRDELRAELKSSQAPAPTQNIVVHQNTNVDNKIDVEPPQETRGQWFQRQHWCIKIVIVLGSIVLGVLWFAWLLLVCLCEILNACLAQDEVVVVRRTLW